MVTLTVYLPGVFTLIFLLISPFDHKYDVYVLPKPVPIPASNNTLSPSQKDVFEAVIVGLGFGLTVMAIGGDKELQPLSSSTLKEYVPVDFTMIDLVVCPLDHL